MLEWCLTCFRWKMPSAAGGTPGQELPTRQKPYRKPARNSAAASAAYTFLTLPAANSGSEHLSRANPIPNLILYDSVPVAHVREANGSWHAFTRWLSLRAIKTNISWVQERTAGGKQAVAVGEWQQHQQQG